MADNIPAWRTIMDNTSETNSVDTNVDNVTENTTPDNNNAAGQEAEIDWKAQARKWEDRAKENFSYKEKAEAYDAYLEAQKTEEEKREEELNRIKNEYATLQAETLKKDIALEKNIPSNLLKYLNGSTKEELEAQADELLSVINESAKPKINPNPEQGKPVEKSTGNSLEEWIKDNIIK